MRLPRLALAAAVATIVTLPLAAQGGPPGGGMGGPGGGMQRMMQMASLERPLAGIDGVTDAQKASLGQVEARYRKEIGEAMAAMRDMMMAARESGTPPDMNEMRKNREAMREMRTKEWAEARALLTAAQQPKFDENTKAILDEETKREAEARARMGGAPPR
jgi:hypothetical protein